MGIIGFFYGGSLAKFIRWAEVLQYVFGGAEMMSAANQFYLPQRGKTVATQSRRINGGC